MRLDSSGKPEFNGNHDLAGKTIVDVRGWAPTEDGLKFVKNSCTGKHFGNFNMVIPEENGNDAAMRMLLNPQNGRYLADGVWIYAD